MRKNKGLLWKSTVCACVASIIFLTPVVAATATTNSWNLVDSGKHLDWDGESNYMIHLTDAVSTWNAYKAGVIRKDTWKIIEDVRISDYSGDSVTVVKVLSNGKIQFNQQVMDTYSDSKKENACAFALGTALGLGATDNRYDIMYKYNTNKTSLSLNDKASYSSAYESY